MCEGVSLWASLILAAGCSTLVAAIMYVLLKESD